MRIKTFAAATLSTFVVALTACGGSDDDAPPLVAAPAAPVVAVSYGIKQLQFSWPAVGGATHYRLLERPDATAAFGQIGTDLARTSINHDIALHRRVNAAYRVEACNSGGCTSSSTISLAANLLPAIGYFKASNTGAFDSFGGTVALSADGTTLAVGAAVERSLATGINGDQTDDTAGVDGAGAVYVFIREGGTWTQQAYVKASNTRVEDRFGRALALSSDGATLAVGAPQEDSGSTGINGDQADFSMVNAGAVYLFIRNAGVWSQQAYIKASTSETGDLFGRALAISGDGTTLAVGAVGESSGATGINGNQLDNSAAGAGAVYLFTRSADVWTQQAYVKASNTGVTDAFGRAVALSGDGATLAVGANGERSNAAGIDGNQLDDSAPNSGAVYVFTRNAGMWTQQAYVKASNAGAGDGFGLALALSGDGATLAVGAQNETSSATGINGDQLDNSAVTAGAVYMFTRTAGVWSQQAYLKASNAAPASFFGVALALSVNGNTLAVGAYAERSSATGIGGNQADTSAVAAGAAYVFTRNADVWSQQSYIKASNTQAGDLFGLAVALSADGGTLAVGGNQEASGATGVNGNQADDTVESAGAVYLY